MDEKFTEQLPAYNQAFADFVAKGEQNYFTAPVASHFYVQKLNNGSAVLILGGAGTAMQPDGTYRPVSDVNGAFTIQQESLLHLANTIIAVVGGEDGAA